MPVKITDLTTSTTITSNDFIQIIDSDDITFAPTGTNKKITAGNAANQLANLISSVPPIVVSALSSKANLASPTFSGNVVLPDTTSIGPVNSSEIGRLSGVTSNIQTQLDLKSPLASPTFTGTVTLPTGTVTSDMILDGTIVNADINASAAIAGTKISPNFGSQNIVTTGTTTATTFIGALTGNANTATILQNARTIAISGSVSGTATSFNGSENITIPVTINDSSITTLKIADANVTQGKLASNVAGNGPAFRAYAGTTTTLPTNSHTKINLTIEEFDTNSNFSNSRFTPSVAGYYLITGTIATSSSSIFSILASIAKNGNIVSFGSGQVNAAALRSTVSDIIYLNGSSDYVELNGYHVSSTSAVTTTGGNQTYFSGCLIRSA